MSDVKITIVRIFVLIKPRFLDAGRTVGTYIFWISFEIGYDQKVLKN